MAVKVGLVLFLCFCLFIYLFIFLYVNPIMDHKGLVLFEHTTSELGNITDHKGSLLLSHLRRRCFIIYHAIAEVRSLILFRTKRDTNSSEWVWCRCGSLSSSHILMAAIIEKREIN